MTNMDFLIEVNGKAVFEFLMQSLIAVALMVEVVAYNMRLKFGLGLGIVLVHHSGLW